MKIRIKFRKYGVMKFIGHLDIMRYFQKAIRRAEIAICYSEGFSPHQIMSFAAPLGVGITSDGEYFDMEVRSWTGEKETVKRLNEEMVEGIEVIGCVRLPDHAKTAMSVVAAADYLLFFKDGYEIPYAKTEFAAKIDEFFTGRQEVLIAKQTKKSEKTIDLKQLVYDFHMTGDEENPMFYLYLSAGSTDNVKPELVLDAFFSYLDMPFDPNAIQIHRLEVYARTKDGSAFVPLIDMGEAGSH